MIGTVILFAALWSHPKVQPPPTDPLLGRWIYSHHKGERNNSGLYPPVAITLVFMQREGDGAIIGHYQAKYKVKPSPTPYPLSPDVEFDLVTSPANPRAFVCTSPNGFNGTLEITQVDGNAMRVEWRDTRRPRSGPRTLNSGVATLIRAK